MNGARDTDNNRELCERGRRESEDNNKVIKIDERELNSKFPRPMVMIGSPIGLTLGLHVKNSMVHGAAKHTRFITLQPLNEQAWRWNSGKSGKSKLNEIKAELLVSALS